jgi:hypothetical protein
MVNTQQVQQQRPPVPKTDMEERMQMVKTLDSMRTALEEMGEQLALLTPVPGKKTFAWPRDPASLARRKECARIFTEGIASLKKYVNDSEARHEAIFFWVDENEDLITEENENGDAEGYLQIEQRRGDDQFTMITLSPKDVKELRLALEADAFDRGARERKHARNLKRRVRARQPVKKNVAN